MKHVRGTPSTVRAINDRLALELLLEHGALSRSQLVQLAGVSKPTASELLTRLEEDGAVVQEGMTTGGRGPNAQLYAVNSEVAYAGAVNAEAGQVRAAIADITGRVVGEATTTADLADGRDPVAVVAQTLRSAQAMAGTTADRVHSIVIGVTGSYDSATDRVVYSGHLPSWEAPGIMAELRTELGVDVIVENDVNLAAVAERTRGGAADEDTFAVLWVAEGLGLALEFGGRLYRGATGGAGEIGYIPIGGRAACFQDSVGAPAIIALAGRHGIAGPTADAVVATAIEGHPGGERFLMELAERLATGIATIAAVIDPPLLILAGSTMATGGRQLLDMIMEEVARTSPFQTRLELTSVEGDPVLAGAIDVAVARVRGLVFGSPPSRPWSPSAPSHLR